MSNIKKVTEKEIDLYVKTAAGVLIDQRAVDVETLHVAKLTTMADYFIFCTGGSTTHIRALSEAVEREMETQYGVRPHHIEGYSEANWVLMDYGFMVIHIFHGETRQFYSLSRLWSDAGRAAPERDGE